MTQSIEITAPSRLHFGMFSFGNPQVRQYGGVGAMVDTPGMKVRLEPAERLETAGPLASRALKFARCVAGQLGLAREPAVRISILATPPEHVGLGVGTTMGMSIAAALAHWADRPMTEPAALARLAGRGRRSAVGAYGFCQGGLIVEAGKFVEPLAPLIAQIRLPETWRFVLVRPEQTAGLSGQAEQQAFASLPPVPRSTTDQLCRETLLHLAPAARQNQFAEFSESLYRYGKLAGECFAAQQGGGFANPRLAAMVAHLRRVGFAGVGQSSWGPTLFIAAESLEHARQVVDAARSRVCAASEPWSCTIAKVDNDGAKISVL